MNLISIWFGIDDARYIILFIPLIIGFMFMTIGYKQRELFFIIGGCIFLIVFGFFLCWIPMTPDLAV